MGESAQAALQPIGARLSRAIPPAWRIHDPDASPAPEAGRAPNETGRPHEGGPSVRSLSRGSRYLGLPSASIRPKLAPPLLLPPKKPPLLRVASAM